MNNQALASGKLIAFIKKHLLTVGAIVIFIAFSLASDKFLTMTNISNMLNMVTLIGIMACAMTFVMIGGNMDLSIGSTMTIGVLLSIALHEISPFVSIFVTLAVGALIGLVIGFLVGVVRINSMIVTLGMQCILEGLTILLADRTYWIADEDRTWFTFIGRGYIGPIPFAVILMFVCILVFEFVLKRTRYGAKLYAVGGNYQGSRYSGINDKAVVVTSFVLMGVMAALAGCVSGARIMVFQLGAGTGYEFDVMSGVILGGTSLAGGEGSVFKTFVGVFIIGMLKTGFVMLGMPYYMQWLIEGVIIIVVVYLDMRNKRKEAAV